MVLHLHPDQKGCTPQGKAVAVTRFSTASTLQAIEPADRRVPGSHTGSSDRMWLDGWKSQPVATTVQRNSDWQW